MLFPAAQQWATQVNEAMTGGHCEGMAVMAQRLFTNTASLADLDPAAAMTFDLAKDDPDVTGAIDFWWTTQMFVPVQEAYMAFHEYEPSEIAKDLAAGIAAGKNYTLAIYSDKGSGHSITPFAVVFDGKTYAISVYDNNYPGTVQQIIVDPEAERWSYAAGATTPGAPTDGWEGGKGKIDLTPMAARSVPTSAPFADSATKGSVTARGSLSNLLVTSADPDTQVGFTLTIDGKTYDTTDPNTVLPDGVYARPLLGAGMSGNGTSVIIDRERVPEFGADGVARSRATDEARDNANFTMSIDSDGAPRVTVRTSTGPRPDERPTFNANDQGGVEVAPPPGREARVNMANGSSSFDAPVPDGGSFNIGPNNRRGEAPVGFSDSEGRQQPGFRIPRDNPGGGVIDSRGRFDPQSGEFVVNQRQGRPEQVNGAQVDQFRAMAGPAPDGGPQGGPDSGPQGGAGTGPQPGASGGPQGGGPAGPDQSGGSGGAGGPTPGQTPAGSGGGGGGPTPKPDSGGGAGGPAPAPTDGSGGGGAGGPAPGPATGSGGGGSGGGGSGGGAPAPAGPAPGGDAPAGPAGPAPAGGAPGEPAPA
ncbi:MAG: hypothetical protein F2836_03725 [Actinobacteria bacterium]|uniref:Unannotated protein n=1 Tax=freshwater metagenome TaxID=449393 RepID=A0A6J7IMC8_9ZZZZ|nr:hypothetical protein [Actinomycetota bacterium]